MMSWLESAKALETMSGVPRMDADSRKVIVVGASGASNLSGTVKKYGETKTCPHFTLDTTNRVVYQHVPLSLAAPLTVRPSPLKSAHLRGTVVWVNLVKRNTTMLSEEETVWAGNQVKKIADLIDFNWVLTRTGGVFATDEWRKFSGICWASCVPGFTSAGPGLLDDRQFFGYVADFVLQPIPVTPPVLFEEPHEELTEVPVPEPKKTSVLGYFKGEPLEYGSSDRRVDKVRLALGLDLGDFDDDLFSAISIIADEAEAKFNGTVDRSIWKLVDKYLTGS